MPSLIGIISMSKLKPCPFVVRMVCRPGFVDEIEQSSQARLVKNKGRVLALSMPGFFAV